MKQKQFLILFLFTIPFIFIQARHIPNDSKVTLDAMIKLRGECKGDRCSSITLPTTSSSITNNGTITPITAITSTTAITLTKEISPFTSITSTTIVTPTKAIAPTTEITPTTAITLTKAITPVKAITQTAATAITPTTAITPSITTWQYKSPCNDSQKRYLTNQVLLCSLNDYPYGWGLRAGDVGCCGNYPGCCQFASVLCWFHDLACTCCGSIWCGPQCRSDPSCDKILSELAVEEGSGEI